MRISITPRSTQQVSEWHGVTAFTWKGRVKSQLGTNCGYDRRRKIVSTLSHCDYQGVTLIGTSSQISTSLGTLGLMNLISFGGGPAPSIAPSQPVDICISFPTQPWLASENADTMSKQCKNIKCLRFCDVLWPTQWHRFHGLAVLNNKP